LVASGALVGSSTLAIIGSGTMTGAGALRGTSTVTLVPSATLRGAGALAASATITIVGSATLVGTDPGSISGSATLSLSGSGTLTAEGEPVQPPPNFLVGAKYPGLPPRMQPEVFHGEVDVVGFARVVVIGHKAKEYPPNEEVMKLLAMV
jgi:hypothetical protein